ncbi:hypothetical protein PhCBS80983_g01158 [Powellomyces hirtus]|uniref:PPM-type phosphatase domain-containing protein n=1 Tax=Powellomyces hirtus TaxID=109895 RepID=A0A507EB43_9FUNG|nr:hypothetical protein PhCBS80983_g01158 [Powellomyces hirtus]
MGPAADLSKVSLNTVRVAQSDRLGRVQDRFVSKYLRIPCPDEPGTLLDIYWFAVFDGHGGDACSEFLKNNLHGHFESARAIDLQTTLTALSSIYERSLTVTDPPPSAPGNTTSDGWTDPLTMSQRLYIAFLKAELEFFKKHPSEVTETCGSTASVTLIRPVHLKSVQDAVIDVVVAHVGDSRVILGAGPRGIAHPLTTSHVPTLKSEQHRIVQLGGFSTPVPEARGEELVLGALAVSRCFGDKKYKKFGGVIVEPQIVTQRLDETHQAAFICMVTDGVSSVAHDQEIVDVIKHSSTPEKACSAILDLSDSLGSQDNKTVTIIRMPAWTDAPPSTASDITRLSRAKRISEHSGNRKDSRSG